MGVGVYFFESFFRVGGLRGGKLHSENVLGSEQVDALWGGHTLQSLMFATSGGFA